VNRVSASMLAAALAACSSRGGAGEPGGDAVFRKCAICHRIEAGAPNGIGPNLHGVFGRKAASLPNFNYSPAMRGTGFTWDAKTLDRYLTAPQQVVPGTRMTFSGLPDRASRKAVIRYLKANSAPR
jgi:cytochrome c2